VNILARLKTLITDADSASEEVFDDLVRHGMQVVGDRRLDDNRVGVRSRAGDAERYRDPGGAEEVWLAKHLSEAVQFIERHTGSVNGAFDPARLDAAFTGWNGCPVLEREEERVVVNALGTAFGQWLVDTQSMAWVVLTDGDDDDFGVRHAQLEITVAPLAIAARRMQSGMNDFFTVLGRLIQREIARAAPQSRD
jgi:hypothetical protein